MARAKIDAIDSRILEMLQRNADLLIADLAEAAGLSQTQRWWRVHRLKEAGVIKGHVTLLDRHQLNVAVTVFLLCARARTRRPGSTVSRGRSRWSPRWWSSTG